MSAAISATTVLATAAVASVGMGAYEMSQQAGQAGQMQGENQTIFGEQQYYANQLQKLIADPSSITSDPAYQFELGQGQDALTRSMTSQGFGQSGNLGAGLVQYGQNYAANAYQQQVNILSGLSGLSAPTSAGQFGQNAITSQNNAYNQMGGQLASLMYLAGNRGGYGGGYSGGGLGPGSYQGVTDSAGGYSPFSPAAPAPGGFDPMTGPW